MAQNETDHRGGGRLSIHREAIRRFLKRLGGAADALGDPPQLHVEIHSGELTRSGAESSAGRYEAGEICHSDCLIITLPTRAHAKALLLSSDRLVSAATGLFSALKIEWLDGDFGFSTSVPHTSEQNHG